MADVGENPPVDRVGREIDQPGITRWGDARLIEQLVRVSPQNSRPLAGPPSLPTMAIAARGW
ncbi:hypothetical protein [Streptomyces venezuelae]|uniref:hypothetical protein n=1 Tax=Streptomyces venezuelae TaxID=54571 RepID=UPI00123AA6CB|nr:hypothetical protein [Streptomyces venezuelae]